MKKAFLLLAVLGALFIVAHVEWAKAQVAASYFAIDNSGTITVTPAGAAAINALTAPTTSFVLTVTATNAGGSGSGTVTVVVTVPVSAPVVQPSSLNLTAPVTSGQTVGTVGASGNPTSWAITGSVP